MICPATPNGSGIGAEAGVIELVGPTGVVEEVRRGERDVDVARLADRLAVVERLHDREFARTLLDQSGDAKEILRALGAGRLRPHLVVGAARGGDRPVDVGAARLGDHRKGLFVRGVDRRELTRAPSASLNAPSMNSP